MPRLLKSSFQKGLVKTLSLSETVVCGMPCSRNMVYRKRLAAEEVENGYTNGKKWPYLVNLQTTTNIAFFPENFFRPSMKSMNICCLA